MALTDWILTAWRTADAQTLPNSKMMYSDCKYTPGLWVLLYSHILISIGQKTELEHWRLQNSGRCVRRSITSWEARVNIRPKSNIHLNEQQLLTANSLTERLLHRSTKTGKASCHSPVKLSQCPAADGVSVRGSSRGLHRPASRSDPTYTTRSPGNRLPNRHSRLHGSGSWQVKFAAAGRGKESRTALPLSFQRPLLSV